MSRRFKVHLQAEGHPRLKTGVCGNTVMAEGPEFHERNDEVWGISQYLISGDYGAHP
jgi:hypothetical protein